MNFDPGLIDELEQERPRLLATINKFGGAQIDAESICQDAILNVLLRSQFVYLPQGVSRRKLLYNEAFIAVGREQRRRALLPTYSLDFERLIVPNKKGGK